MSVAVNRKLARSKPETFSTGDSIDVDTAFLQREAKRMRAPVIDELVIEFTGDVTGDANTAKGEDAYRILTEIQISDRGGDLVKIHGEAVRIIEQLEIGSRQVDNAALASGVQNSSYKQRWRIFFSTPGARTHREEDTALPVIHLTDGGGITLSMGTPTGFTIASGTFLIYAKMRDARERKLYTRKVWKQRVVSDQEGDVRVDGSLRAAFFLGLLDTTGFVDLSSYTSLDSTDLGFPSGLASTFLDAEYVRESVDRASDDEFVANNVLPFFAPRKGQRIGRLPDLESMHYDLGAAAVSNLKVLVCVIEDRVASLAAEWMGEATVQDLVAKVRQQGFVDTKGGKRIPASHFDATLARRLPIRFAGVA